MPRLNRELVNTPKESNMQVRETMTGLLELTYYSSSVNRRFEVTICMRTIKQSKLATNVGEAFNLLSNKSLFTELDARLDMLPQRAWASYFAEIIRGLFLNDGSAAQRIYQQYVRDPRQERTDLRNHTPFPLPPKKKPDPVKQVSKPSIGISLIGRRSFDFKGKTNGPHTGK